MNNKLSTKGIPIKILLVDDDDDDIILFSDALTNIPVSTELITANNGQIALKILQSTSSHLPDLIFLDLHMPVMRGIELLTVVKTNDLYRLIPCIILTGVEIKSYINQAYSLGANLFVVKPIDHSKLKKIIEKVLDLDWRDYFPPKSESFHFKEDYLQ